MKRIIAVFLMLICVFAFSGCSFESEDATDINIMPGETEEAVNNAFINLQMRTPDTLDPLTTERKSVRDGMLCVYEPLFNVTEDFSLEAVLAENYAFNNNATIMTVKLKEDVLWHNNDVFTAADVIYTVNKIKEDSASSYYQNLKSVERVEKQGTYEVVFYLKEPDAYLPYVLYFPIEHVGIDADERCVGTGPFRYKEEDKDSLTLVKNNSWHKGEVVSDGVKFIYVRNSYMAQEAFASGKIHAVTKEFIDTENFSIKKSNTKNYYPDGIFEFVGFNTTKGVFSDPLVRAAFSNALDRNEMAEIFDEAQVSGFPIMSGSGLFSPSYELSSYDLDYAKELLFSAGWRDSDGNNVVEKLVGEAYVEARVVLLVSDRDRARLAAANAIKEQSALLGIDVTVDVTDIDTYNQRVWGGQFDCLLGGVYYDAPYNVKNLLKTGGSVNYQGYKSEDMDITLENFAATWDMNYAPGAFAKLQSVYAAHQPVTGLVFRRGYVLTNEVLEGDIKPYPYSPYANVWMWAIKTDITE